MFTSVLSQDAQTALAALGKSGRTKKDYIDVYTLAQRGMTLETMFLLYEQKFHMFESNKFTLIKSLTYFEEADADNMPQMVTPVSWDEVKKYFISESLRLGKHYLEEV